jgi:hypothetical protein
MPLPPLQLTHFPAFQFPTAPKPAPVLLVEFDDQLSRVSEVSQPGCKTRIEAHSWCSQTLPAVKDRFDLRSWSSTQPSPSAVLNIVGMAGVEPHPSAESLASAQLGSVYFSCVCGDELRTIAKPVAFTVHPGKGAYC